MVSFTFSVGSHNPCDRTYQRRWHAEHVSIWPPSKWTKYGQTLWEVAKGSCCHSLSDSWRRQTIGWTGIKPYSVWCKHIFWPDTLPL